MRDPIDEPKWRRYLRFWRSSVPRDIDDELHFHFEARVEELIASGASAESARQTAYGEFGDVNAFRRRLEEIDLRMEGRRARAMWWDHMRSDIRYAVRGFRHSPIVTLTIVATLALGIGAVASMYGVMRALLLRPPPHVVDPARVEKLYYSFSEPGEPRRVIDASSYPAWEYIRDGATAFSSLAAYVNEDIAVGSVTDGRRVKATLVSAGFFRTMGTRPMTGRFFTDAECHPVTGGRVVVLGYSYWQRQYRGDRSVLGQKVIVNNLPYEIVGVTPRGFRGVELKETELWLPFFAYADGKESPVQWHTMDSNYFLRFVGRLAPNATHENAASQSNYRFRLFYENMYRNMFRRRAGREFPASARAVLAPVTKALGHDMEPVPEARISKWLVGVSVMLLLIAVANASGLLLLRAMRRRREIAVRLALGVRYRRLFGQLLTESAVLGVLAAVAGAAVAIVASRVVQSLLLPEYSLSSSTGVDPFTLVAVITAAILATAVTGAAPMMLVRSSRPELRETASQFSARHVVWHRSLLATQAALSVVLLLGAGLFVRSLQRLRNADVGLDTHDVMAIQIDLEGSGRTSRAIAQFMERALERVRSVPGVEQASLAMSAPLLGSARGGGLFRMQNDSVFQDEAQGSPTVNEVTPGFFGTTGLRIIQGRDFTESERDSGAAAVIVNQEMVKRYWSGRSPVGECVKRKRGGPCVVVVGVVENAHLFRIREEQRHLFYVPLTRSSNEERSLVLRVVPGAPRMIPTLRAVLAELDTGLPYVDIRTLQSALDPEMRPWRLGATIFSTFGSLAILLAAIGLTAAVAYAVTQRSREIGVRMAIGARGAHVVRLVLRDGLVVGVVGVGVGVALGLAASPWTRGLLYEVSPRDVTVFASVSAIVLGATVLASLGPALRALRIDPASVLRSD